MEKTNNDLIEENVRIKKIIKGQKEDNTTEKHFIMNQSQSKYRLD